MTDCPRAEIRDLLPEWVHGTLPADQAADVAEHLATCAACAAEVELLATMRGVLDTAPAIDPSRIAREVVRRTTARQQPARWRRTAGALAIAASIAMAVVVMRDDRATVPATPVAALDTTTASPVVSPEAPAVPDEPPGTDSARPPVAPPATVPPAAPERQVTPRSELPAPSMRLASAGLSVGGGIADLGEDQLEALLNRLEAMEALPQTAPAPAIVTDFVVR